MVQHICTIHIHVLFMKLVPTTLNIYFFLYESNTKVFKGYLFSSLFHTDIAYQINCIQNTEKCILLKMLIDT